MRHGYGAYTQGCRCETCKRAKAAYMAERRGAAYLTTDTGPVEDITHGRYGYEERGCRCEVCVEARRGEWRKFRAGQRAKAGDAAA